MKSFNESTKVVDPDLLPKSFVFHTDEQHGGQMYDHQHAILNLKLSQTEYIALQRVLKSSGNKTEVLLLQKKIEDSQRLKHCKEMLAEHDSTCFESFRNDSMQIIEPASSNESFSEFGVNRSVLSTSRLLRSPQSQHLHPLNTNDEQLVIARSVSQIGAFAPEAVFVELRDLLDIGKDSGDDKKILKKVKQLMLGNAKYLKQVKQLQTQVDELQL